MFTSYVCTYTLCVWLCLLLYANCDAVYNRMMIHTSIIRKLVYKHALAIRSPEAIVKMFLLIFKPTQHTHKKYTSSFFRFVVLVIRKCSSVRSDMLRGVNSETIHEPTFSVWEFQCVVDVFAKQCSLATEPFNDRDQRDHFLSIHFSWGRRWCWHN